MATHKNFKALFRALEKKNKTLRSKAPTVLSNVGTNFFNDRFKKANWINTSAEKWPEVQRRIKGTKAYKYPKKRGLGRRTRAILVGTGDLRRAVSRSLKSKSDKRVVWQVMGKQGEYGYYHNYGTKTLKQRKFMGDSKFLRFLFKKKLGLMVKEIYNT